MGVDITALQQEIELRRHLRRIQARKRLIDFSQYTFENYIANWHHRKYAEVLDRFASGEIKKLMVFMPSQHGKSELCSRRLPAKMLGDNPNLRIAVVAYNHTFSSKFNRSIQRIILTNRYKELYPDTTLNTRNVSTDSKGSYLRNSTEFEIVGHKGSLISVGVCGGLTGNKVDVAIIDDPYKDMRAATSQKITATIEEWWYSVLVPRLHEHSRICLTFTRWSDKDIASYILKREDDWTIVKFPALKVGPPNDFDPREHGQALWPSHLSAASLKKRQKFSPTIFEAMYQQNPVPESGAIIKRKWFKYVSKSIVPDTERICFADTAYTEDTKNDPSAAITATTDGSNLYILNYTNVRMEYPDLKRHLSTFANITAGKSARFYVEPKANGLSLIQDLRSHLNTIPYKLPDGDKLNRTKINTAYLESGRVLLVEAHWNEDFVNECVRFDKVDHDEAVDLLNMAITQLMKRNNNDWTGQGSYA